MLQSILVFAQQGVGVGQTSPSPLFGWLWVVVPVSGILVYADAKAIGARKGLLAHGIGNNSAGMWGIATVLMWIVVLPLYLVYRPRIKEAKQAEMNRSHGYGAQQASPSQNAWQPQTPPTFAVPPIEPQLPPAGWYIDPNNADLNRWWDGTVWTEHQNPRLG